MHLTSADDKIYITGYQRMVGSAIWAHLGEAGYENLMDRISEELDLRDPGTTREFFKAEQPESVILAPDQRRAVDFTEVRPKSWTGWLTN